MEHIAGYFYGKRCMYKFLIAMVIERVKKYRFDFAKLIYIGYNNNIMKAFIAIIYRRN